MMAGYLCGIAAALFWGFDTVVIRWLIAQGIDPFVIAALRLLIGSGTLTIALTVKNAAGSAITKRKIFPTVRYTKVFWLITVSLAANFILFHKGLEYTIASDAVLLESFSPVMVIILIMLFLPERVRHLMHQNLPQKVLKIVIIGSIGSSFLLVNDPMGIFGTSESKLTGDLIEFAAMFAWALVMLGMHEHQKREGEQNILAATAHFLFFAGILMAPFADWGQVMNFTDVQWAWVIVLGVCSTGLAYLLWHTASRLLDVFPLMTLFNLVSIFTVITESVFLGLAISWKLVVGGTLILYAAMMAKRMNAKYKLMGTEQTQSS